MSEILRMRPVMWGSVPGVRIRFLQLGNVPHGNPDNLPFPYHLITLSRSLLSTSL